MVLVKRIILTTTTNTHLTEAVVHHRPLLGPSGGKGNAQTLPSLPVDDVPQADGMARLGPVPLLPAGRPGPGLLVPDPQVGRDGGAAPGALEVVGGPADDLGVEVVLRQGLRAEDVGGVAAVAAPEAETVGGRRRGGEDGGSGSSRSVLLSGWGAWRDGDVVAIVGLLLGEVVATLLLGGTVTVVIVLGLGVAILGRGD